MDGDLDRRDYAYPGGPGTFQNGLSKRELFAAMAMQGMLSNDEGFDGDTHDEWQAECAIMAVGYTDALLAELAKPRGWSSVETSAPDDPAQLQRDALRLATALKQIDEFCNRGHMGAGQTVIACGDIARKALEGIPNA